MAHTQRKFGCACAGLARKATQLETAFWVLATLRI